MDGEVEKVYVALGSDLQDGFKTLEWAIRKWSSHPISIVILHVTCDKSKDFVSTPYGKLPASSVSEEKLEVIRKYEQAKVDKLLSNYIAFCGKVKAEILKVEKYDEPIRKLVIDLISGIQMTKLVMGLTFMKSSSGRSKGAISGAFYVHQNKPDFCELFIICGGKLVFLRGENEEGIMEDDEGITVAKILREKGSLKGWLGKMFSESLSSSSLERNFAQANLDSPNSTSQWDHYNEELERYFQRLVGEEDDVLQTYPTEPQIMPQREQNESDMSVEERTEHLRSKIDEARKAIQENRNQYKANFERTAKAEWAICLCNQRLKELETRTKEEAAKRMDSEKKLDLAKEEFQEMTSEVRESKNKISRLVELQSHLSNRLRAFGLAKSDTERQLERAVMARAETVREIEELRRQRDVLQRRIEFCKDKEAIGNKASSSEVSLSYRKYTAKEMRLATNDFSDRMRIKYGGNWTNVYRGLIDHFMVAIKMLNWVQEIPQLVFQDKVRLLSDIRHPHLVGMIGFCSELNCIVLEYMENGNVAQLRGLQWFDRIRIAAEAATGLAFLHMAKPRPIVHGDLTLSNILVDGNHVAKITGFVLTRSDQEEHSVRSDVRAFGVLMLELLAGPNWSTLVEEAMEMGEEILAKVLEATAGKWPPDLAEEFARIALRCGGNGLHTDLRMATLVEELNELRNKANDAMNKNGGCEMEIAERNNIENSSTEEDVPGIFLCPIFKEVMQNPHVAADGFSYEQEAIQEWLETGHDRSPMTNLRLNHTSLTPNHILRSLIEDWHYRRSSGAA